MEDINEWVKSLDNSGLLIKELVKQSKLAKEQKRRSLSILLGTLDASLLGNILADKGINRAGEGFIRAGYWSLIKNKAFEYCLIL